MEVVTVNEILEQTVKDTSNLKYIYCHLVSNYEDLVVLQIYYNPIKVLSDDDIKNILTILNQYNLSVNEVHVFKITSNLLNRINNAKDLNYATRLKLELLHCLEHTEEEYA